MAEPIGEEEFEAQLAQSMAKALKPLLSGATSADVFAEGASHYLNPQISLPVSFIENQMYPATEACLRVFRDLNLAKTPAPRIFEAAVLLAKNDAMPPNGSTCVASLLKRATSRIRALRGRTEGAHSVKIERLKTLILLKDEVALPSEPEVPDVRQRLDSLLHEEGTLPAEPDESAEPDGPQPADEPDALDRLQVAKRKYEETCKAIFGVEPIPIEEEDEVEGLVDSDRIFVDPSLQDAQKGPAHPAPPRRDSEAVEPTTKKPKAKAKAAAKATDPEEIAAQTRKVFARRPRPKTEKAQLTFDIIAQVWNTHIAPPLNFQNNMRSQYAWWAVAHSRVGNSEKERSWKVSTLEKMVPKFLKEFDPNVEKPK